MHTVYYVIQDADATTLQYNTQLSSRLLPAAAATGAHRAAERRGGAPPRRAPPHDSDHDMMGGQNGAGLSARNSEPTLLGSAASGFLNLTSERLKLMRSNSISH